jgi:hypothetical protein
LRPTASHQDKGAEGQAQQQSEGCSQQTQRIDTQKQTENGEHLQAVVLNKTSTPVHGLKGSAAVMNQQRQRQHLGEEAGSNDQSSKDHNQARQGCTDLPDGPTQALNQS